MGKLDPRQVIQKRRTEEEMRSALSSFVRGSSQRSIPPQDDDTDIILLDCIAELLQSRQLLAEMQNFSQLWLAKLPKR